MFKVDRLLDFASDFAADIFRVSGEDGTTWIRNHVGNAIFHMGLGSDWILKNELKGASGAVITNHDVPLQTTFANTNYGEYTLIHEMGHVFDNNVKDGFWPATYNGGGPSDAMVSALQGNPGMDFIRFSPLWGNRWYQNNVAGPYAWPNEADYGNHGVAGDFADTFAYTLIGGRVPPKRELWMTSFLNLLP